MLRKEVISFLKNNNQNCKGLPGQSFESDHRKQTIRRGLEAQATLVEFKVAWMNKHLTKTRVFNEI